MTILRWSHETGAERQRDQATSLLLPQYLLGARYAEGPGVAADILHAFVWFRKAAANGYPPAEQALQDLELKSRSRGASAVPVESYTPK